VLTYESPSVALRLRRRDYAILSAEPGPVAPGGDAGEALDLRPLFELDLLIEGVSASLGNLAFSD
jgi:hypothetical protein